MNHFMNFCVLIAASLGFWYAPEIADQMGFPASEAIPEIFRHPKTFTLEEWKMIGMFGAALIVWAIVLSPIVSMFFPRKCPCPPKERAN